MQAQDKQDNMVTYWKTTRAEYIEIYKNCAKDCEPVFHELILQCEVIISGLLVIKSLQSNIAKRCDGK